MKWQRLMWLCNWRRWEAARAFCQWLMWKSCRSRARERCLLQPSLQPLQLPIPSSRSELILKLKTNQFLTRMGPYHNRPIYHSMKSPSQPWAQQVPTPPSPGLDSNLPQSHHLTCPASTILLRGSWRRPVEGQLQCRKSQSPAWREFHIIRNLEMI